MQIESEALHRSGWGVLAGGWAFTSPLFPGAEGRAVFEWLDGRGFLVQRSFPPAGAPASTSIIGADGDGDECAALYCDSRGTSRVYRTSLRDAAWRIWRDDPEFAQRFSAQVAPGAQEFRGAWESSQRGGPWKHDFDLTYTRVRRGTP